MTRHSASFRVPSVALLLVWCGLSPVALAAAQPWPAVTLEEALARGRKHAPQVIRAQGERQLAEAGEKRAFGAWLPTASVNAGSTLASSSRFIPGTDVQISGSNTSVNAGVSVSWAVFTGGRRGAEREQARAQATSADASLVQQEAEVAFLVERAFYEEQREEELLAVARAREQRAIEGLAAAERRAQVGSATRSDVLRARLELNTARESLRQAETRRHAAAFALGRLLGMEGPADARLDAPLEAKALALPDEEVVSLLLSQAPSVKSAEAATRFASAGIGAAKAQYYPSVRLSAGHDWFAQDLEFARGQNAWSMRLGLSWPIFDGFLRDETLTRAQVQASVADAQLADVRRAVRSETEGALANLRFQHDRIRFAEEAVDVALEDLRVHQERYGLGMSTMLDLLTSQTSLVQAESALVSARFDYQLARSELEALAGRRL